MLLDTCALIWLAMGGGPLSKTTLKTLAEARNVQVCSISAFEIALKYQRGGLELPCDPAQWYQRVLEQHDVTEIPLTGELAIAATKLPEIHRDPCDRFIIATARFYRLPIVTADARFREYGVEILG